MKRKIIGMLIAGIVHVLLVIAFRLENGPVVGTEADSAAIAWGVWFALDLPLSLLYILLEDIAYNDFSAVAGIALIGGVQWGLWYLCVILIIERWTRKCFR